MTDAPDAAAARAERSDQRLTRLTSRLSAPLKAWGDTFASQGRWAEARAKYDEALRYAPAWAALKLARASAARAQ